MNRLQANLLLTAVAVVWASAFVAQSLGMNDPQTMRLIVLPQALRRMVPPLVNEAITLLKDSSLVSAIGLAERAMAARTVADAYSRY